MDNQCQPKSSYNVWLRDTSSTKLSLTYQNSLVVLLEVQSVLESLLRQATITERSKIYTALTKVRHQTKVLHRLATIQEKVVT